MPQQPFTYAEVSTPCVQPDECGGAVSSSRPVYTAGPNVEQRIKNLESEMAVVKTDVGIVKQRNERIEKKIDALMERYGAPKSGQK